MIIVVRVHVLAIIHPEKTFKIIYQLMFSSTLHRHCIIPSKKLLISNSRKLSFLTLKILIKVISFTFSQTRQKFESEIEMGGYFTLLSKMTIVNLTKKSYLWIQLFIIMDFSIYYILINIEQEFSKYYCTGPHHTHEQ